MKLNYSFYDSKKEKKQLKLKNLLDSSPTIYYLENLIKEAIEANASDIHMEPYENMARIRVRIDGVLYEKDHIDIGLYGSVVLRIKVISNLNISENRRPQDGKIISKYLLSENDFRVSILPTMFGEKVVIRILYKGELLQDLDNIGFSKDDYKKVVNLISKDQGMILLTGPTGSGKTTTMYSILNYLNGISRNIITIEDPVEYVIYGINQVNVNYKAGVDFACGLRSILRQDPDIIMVGEVRDEETASIAVRAAITGHLVLSTIHARNSLATITRLTDMGMPLYIALEALNLVVSQRLVRKICPHCRKEIKITERVLMDFKDKIYKSYLGEGCEHCNYTGYASRVMVYELLILDEALKNEIKSNNNRFFSSNENKLKYSALSINGINLVNNGITTVDELYRITMQ